MENNNLKDFGHNIVAILNQKGMEEIEFSLQDYTENMMCISLTYDETIFLDNSVFSDFNEKFEIFIGLYEEDKIANENLQEALNITKNALDNEKTEIGISALKKMQQILEKAIECNTCVLVEI